jgi:hypothetical protein
LYSLTIAVLVTGAPPPVGQPDLIIEDVWQSGNTIYYKIKNQGAVSAGATTSALVVDGVVKGFDAVGSLAVGASSTESFAYSYACSGASDTIVVHADKDNVVAENNEGNNAFSKTWSCPEKTVTLNTISAEDGGVQKEGATYTRYAGPCAGDTPANGTRRGFLSFDISGIPAGSTITEAMLDLSAWTKDGDPTFATLGFFEVYHYQYGTYADLDATDYEAAAKLVKGGRFSAYPFSPWKWDVKESYDGTPVLQNLVNGGNPRFQLRFQFSIPTDNDNNIDFLCFTGATLAIKYKLP